jgi:N-acetylglucosaminyldiphosphoundecaprenol N-acetyl-beta-D-mannosaminyltransferase
MDTFKVFGYNLIVRDLAIVPLDKKVLVNTISPNSYGLASKDKETDEALKGSDYLVLDGVYFGLAPLLLNGKRIKRITGWDCFSFFSEKMNEKSGRVFFMGSSPATLAKIVARYKIAYPKINAGTYSPPFKPIFSEADNIIIRQHINEFRPDVLFVGLTAPKQEKWGYQNIKNLDVHVISTIGNVFDWYAGNSIRPGKIWQKMGLEWLVRIFHRPEVFLRNINNQMIFFRHLLLIFLKIKKYD